MRTLILSNHRILKVACDYNISVTPTLFALELPEPLSTIHLSVNTDSSSFLGKTFCVLVVHTLSNLGNIFCMIVGGLTTIGIQEETPLLTSSYSSNLTAKPFPLGKTLLHLQTLCCQSDVMCNFSFVCYLCCSFLSSSFLFFMLLQSACT